MKDQQDVLSLDRFGILRRGRPYALACASLCLLVPLHFLPPQPTGNRPEPGKSARIYS